MLHQLHHDYAGDKQQKQPPSILRDLPVRLPLIRDFVEDYEKALGRWNDRIAETFGSANVERLEEGFVCVRLQENRDALAFLRLYQSFLADSFPKLIGQPSSPLRLAISIAPAKHPFSVTWRFLENARAPISVLLLGSGRAEILPNRLAEILALIERGDRRTCHRLRDIARTSKALAELVVDDRTERDRGFESLRRILPLGMDFESLVTIANIAGSEARR